MKVAINNYKFGSLVTEKLQKLQIAFKEVYLKVNSSE